MQDAMKVQKMRERFQNYAGHRYFPFLIIFIITILSIVGINRYQFGLLDQAITIPFLKDFLRTELYPCDYLLEQQRFYYTYLWMFLGIVSKSMKIAIPYLFFLVYFSSIFLTFLAIFKLSLTLFGKSKVAYLSLLLFLFTGGYPGSVFLLDSVLLARMVALPALIFGIRAYLKGEKALVAIYLCIGFFIHPMSTAFVAGGILFSFFWRFKTIGARKLVSFVGLFLVISSPVLVWKILYTPESLHLIAVDPLWFELLKLRSAHHIFPSTWSFNDLLKVCLTLTILFVSFSYKPAERLHGKVCLFITGILFFCFVGVLFTEIIPVSIILNFQPIRSFKFIPFFAIIYYANYFFVFWK